MSSRFLSLVTDEVRTNEVIFATSSGEKLGTVIVENNKFVFDPPIVLGANEELRVGVTGNFTDSEGVTSTQSTNVVSYNPKTKTTTFRELGLYNDNVPMLTKTGSEVNDYRIVSNYSIVPRTHGISEGDQGYSLGNENAHWNSIYTKDVFTTTNGSMYVLNPDNGEQMSIKYNPVDLTATLSNNNFTVKSVSTSINIPGQIDPQLLPFAGLSFGGTFKPKTFTQNVGTDFDVHTKKIAYTLILDILSEYSSYDDAPSTRTNALFRMLNGSYYVVNGIGDGYTQDMTFSKLVAETDLTSYNRDDGGVILSSFTSEEPETFTLADNQLIILSVGLEANKENDKINITMRWNLVNFKVPVNGVTTFNIVDNAITNPKLAANSVSTINIRSKSITNDKLIDNAVKSHNIKNGAISFEKLTNDVQQLLLNPPSSDGDDNGVSQNTFNLLLKEVQNSRAEIDDLKDQIKLVNSRWETRVLAIDEYIKGMMRTYVLEKNNEMYKYTGKYESNLVDLLNFEIIGKINPTTFIISIDAYTYNVLYTNVNIRDDNGNIIATFDKDAFNITSLKTQVELNEKYINVEYFPLKLDVEDLSGNVIEYVTLSFNNYENLPYIV